MANRQPKAHRSRRTLAQQQTSTEHVQPPVARITYQDPETATEVEVPLESTVFVVLAHATTTWGRERVHALLSFAAALVQPELSAIDRQRLDLALTAVERYIAQWDDLAELALLTSYKQVWTGELTDAEAAIFASALLGKQVRAPAWRKRVDRWAVKQGLPPLDSTHANASARERPEQGSLLDGA